MRRATSQDEMNKVQTERDLEDFIRITDRDKLLTADEFERFTVALRDPGEDHERMRHLIVVEPGSVTDLGDLRVRERVMIRGTVVDEVGQPVEVDLEIASLHQVGGDPASCVQRRSTTSSAAPRTPGASP